LTRGERLEKARLRAELPRSAVAKACDCDQSTVYRWETDKNCPSLGDVEILAKLYHAKASWLAFGEGPMTSR
jgi:transcriptional regulator with XRE-family HTH domain